VATVREVAYEMEAAVCVVNENGVKRIRIITIIIIIIIIIIIAVFVAALVYFLYLFSFGWHLLTHRRRHAIGEGTSRH
jgi:hypothetical protein